MCTKSPFLAKMDPFCDPLLTGCDSTGSLTPSYSASNYPTLINVIKKGVKNHYPKKPEKTEKNGFFSKPKKTEIPQNRQCPKIPLFLVNICTPFEKYQKY